MLTENQREKFSSLKVELIDLNILACSYVWKINRLGYLLQNTTRKYVFEELTALRYIENGLILHLTNLDDDNSIFSFRKILNETNKTIIDQKIIKSLILRLKSFRQNVNYLKVQHRNKRIAHLNYLRDLNFDQFLDFDQILKPLIAEANEIGDMLWNRKIEYKLNLGKHEEIINFRENFDKLLIDINGIREFS